MDKLLESKGFKVIMVYARMVDVIMVVVSPILAFINYAHGEVDHALFWMLVATFFSRGQIGGAWR